MRSVRGIRGAVRVDQNSTEAIFAATQELLSAMVRENDVEVQDIASVFFTVTTDLDAEFPALAAREIGWQLVPLLCAREIDVPRSMSGVIRVLMHVNTTRTQAQIRHQYLGDAVSLRPDLKRGSV